MEWTQFAIFFIGVFGLFIWNRTESRADMRHMDTKLDSFREETNAMIKAIQNEMKDFHTKLALQDQEYKNHLMNMHKEVK